MDDKSRFGFDRLSLCLALVASAVAVFSARDFAGSWNDGSRLATVESLVDYHTWAIDQSIFVKGTAPSGALSPYPATQPQLRMFGTQDKMWINGHFYSDKTPVPALYFAIVYRVIKFVSGLSARDQPNWFCYWMTLASSGIAYVISVYAIDRLASVHGLSRRARVLLTASFAFGTIALPYARQVNSHILLLAVCSVLLLTISRTQSFSPPQLFLIGSLIGAGYTLDLAIGAILVIGIALLTAVKTREWAPPLVILIAAFPWFALHHALNLRIAGTFLPANAHLKFFQWSGSPFSANSLTGVWHHHSAYEFIGYALDLLVGSRGFLGHNLPLLLALIGTIWLLRQPIPEKREIWFAIGFSVFSWLIYALSSNNHAGLCCSVRWFVPLLAPGYYILVLLLKYDVRAEIELRILSIGGFILGAFMWSQGPWIKQNIPGYWFIVGVTCLVWIFFRSQRVGATSRKS